MVSQTAPNTQRASAEQQPDPFLAQVDGLIAEIEAHSNQNRGHLEQGLYTEALPRIIAIFKSIRNCLDLEELPLPPEDFSRPDGAYLEIRYQTATAIEALLIRLYSTIGEQDDQVMSCIYQFLQDIYGYDEQGIIAHLQMIKDTQIVQRIEELDKEKQENPTSKSSKATNKGKKSKKG